MTEKEELELAPKASEEKQAAFDKLKAKFADIEKQLNAMMATAQETDQAYKKASGALILEEAKQADVDKARAARDAAVFRLGALTSAGKTLEKRLEDAGKALQDALDHSQLVARPYAEELALEARDELIIAAGQFGEKFKRWNDLYAVAKGSHITGQTQQNAAGFAEALIKYGVRGAEELFVGPSAQSNGGRLIPIAELLDT